MKYFKFEDKSSIKNLWESEEIFCQKTDKRIPWQKLEKMNIGNFMWKLRTTDSVKSIAGRKLSATVISNWK